MGGLTETYSYDAGDKLTHVQWFEGSKSFEYDGLGRRTSQTDATGTTTYTWDHQSRLASVSRPGSPTNSFAYNALGARVSSVSSAGSQTFQRDGAFVTDPVISDSGATYTPGISERRNGTTTYLHSGLKNSDSRTVSSSGIAASRTYDAFGNLVSSTGTWQGPFGYGGAFGYQEGGDYGLKLLGHRYLDSTTGTLLSRDRARSGRNWFGYCANNPVKFADPSGLSPTMTPELAELAGMEAEAAGVTVEEFLASTQGEALRQSLGRGLPKLAPWVKALLVSIGLLAPAKTAERRRGRAKPLFRVVGPEEEAATKANHGLPVPSPTYELAKPFFRNPGDAKGFQMKERAFNERTGRRTTSVIYFWPNPLGLGFPGVNMDGYHTWMVENEILGGVGPGAPLPFTRIPVHNGGGMRGEIVP